MGHALRRFRHDSPHLPRFNPRRSGLTEKFPDLNELPPELAILILSNLNATDLCLAMCVNDFWRQLAMDDLLWQGLVLLLISMNHSLFYMLHSNSDLS